MQPRSLRQLKGTLDRFLAYLLDIRCAESICVNEIVSADVAGFLDTLTDRDGIQMAKRKTYNNNRLDLSSFFSWASDRQQKFIPENPVTAVTYFDKKTIEQQREAIEVLSPVKVRELFDYLESYKNGGFCRHYALLLFAGLLRSSLA